MFIFRFCNFQLVFLLSVFGGGDEAADIVVDKAVADGAAQQGPFVGAE